MAVLCIGGFEDASLEIRWAFFIVDGGVGEIDTAESLPSDLLDALLDVVELLLLREKTLDDCAELVERDDLLLLVLPFDDTLMEYGLECFILLMMDDQMEGSCGVDSAALTAAAIRSSVDLALRWD